MKVILIKDVAKVGRAYEVKDLADGFARNFIIARGFGLLATPATLRQLEQKKVQAKTVSLNIPPETKIIITAKATDGGHLFAGVHERDIVAALKEQTKIDLPENLIVLAQPIKTVGEFVVKVKTGSVASQFQVLIERSPS